MNDKNNIWKTFLLIKCILSFLMLSNADELFSAELAYDSDNSLLMLDDEFYKVNRDGSLTKLEYSNEDMDEDSFSMGMATASIGVGVGVGRQLFKIINFLWRYLNKTEFIKKIKRFLFPRKISNIEKNIMKQSKIKRLNGKNVAQRDKLINKMKKCGGKNSCESMRQGGAPFDDKCFPIQLHHVMQEDDGIIMELTQDEHFGNYSQLHKHSNVSEIDRTSFDNWRRTYWKQRAASLCD